MGEIEEASAVALEARDVLLLRQVEKRLANELAADVVDCGGEILVAGSGCDGLECGGDGGGGCDVSADADGVAAIGVYLVDDRVVGVGGASEEKDGGVGGGEFEGKGTA